MEKQTKFKYLTAPVPSTEMPKGIPYIVGNEAAERFSYYGMKTILVIFMTKYVLDKTGSPDYMTGDEAKFWYHLFSMSVYAFPLIGALIADVFLGKYKTIITLSIVYCLGHLTLALDDTRFGLALGLALIAMGSGGIKPCVSANVGDQFGKSNEHLIEKVFGWFYFSINLGAFFSSLMTPVLLDSYGPSVAFGVPGLLMFIATVVFWMGRKFFVHIPPGGKEFLKESFSKEGLGAMLRLIVIYCFVAMFWSLFDQTGSAWVLQAEKMDKNFMGIEWLSSQIQAINPIMIMVFIPIFSYWIYPTINRFFKLTPLRKIGIGFFVTVPAFLIPAWIEMRIAAGELPNIFWQILAYLCITAAEVFVSITALEFSYTQSPKSMKSWIMGLYLASVALGNFFTAGVNFVIQNEPPSFKTDKKGVYELKVTVSDGKATVSENVRVRVLDPEEKKKYDADRRVAAKKRKSKKAMPSCSAGNPRVVKPGSQRVLLYGSIDRGDYRGQKLYDWRFVQVPPGSKLTKTSLRRIHTLNPDFTPDVEGVYELEFLFMVKRPVEYEYDPDSGKVQLQKPLVARSKVKIYVQNINLPPVVNARKETVTTVGSLAELDASESFDPNGDKLTYKWEVVKAPEGSSVTTKAIISANLPGKTSKLEGAMYYLFFAGAMLLTALLFVPVAMRYKGKTYVQDEAPIEEQRKDEPEAKS